MKIKNKALMLMGLTMIGRITGLLREVMLSYFFGASAISDAYVVATTFSTVIFAGLAAAILNGYVPQAVVLDSKQNNYYTTKFLLQTVIVSIVLSFVLLLLLDYILLVLAKGFAPEAMNYARQLSRYVIVFSPLLCVINVMVGYLQVNNSFNAASLQSILTNTVMIIVFYLSLGNVLKLGMGYGFSLILPTITIILFAFKKGYQIQYSSDVMREEAKATWGIIVPTLGVQLAIQINSIIDRSFASTLKEGTVSSMKYAFLICTLVVSIIAVSIGMIRYPQIAKLLSYNSRKDLSGVINDTIQQTCLLILPISITIIVFSKSVIEILFQHGAFTEQDTLYTAPILQIYAAMIIANSFQEIISRVLLAAKHTRALFYIYIIYVGLNILFNVYLIRMMGARGLALGTTLSTYLCVIFMMAYLKCRHNYLNLSENLKPLLRILAATVVMFLIMILLSKVHMAYQGKIAEAIRMGMICAIGGLSYFVVLVLLKEKWALLLYKKYFEKR